MLVNLLRGKREEKKKNKEAKFVFILKVSGVGRKTDGTERKKAGALVWARVSLTYLRGCL